MMHMEPMGEMSHQCGMEEYFDGTMMHCSLQLLKNIFGPACIHIYFPFL